MRENPSGTSCFSFLFNSNWENLLYKINLPFLIKTHSSVHLSSSNVFTNKIYSTVYVFSEIELGSSKVLMPLFIIITNFGAPWVPFLQPGVFPFDL